MPYWMLDDHAPTNRKVRALLAPVLLEGDLSGMAAGFLWCLAGATSQAAGSDGLVSVVHLASITGDRTVAEQLAHHLVAAGLFHEPGHACARCEAVPPHHWRFHDWFDLRYKPGDVMRLAWAKSKENKRPEIVDAVWLRDCADTTVPSRTRTAYCRYCGKLVKRADHTSEDAPQLDHVDPTKAAGPSNLVVSCGTCNRRKASRTPADAGMTLRPAPRALAAAPDLAAPAAAVSPARADAETPAGPAAEQDAEPAPTTDLAAPAAAVSPAPADAETPAGPAAEQDAAEPRASQPTPRGSRASQKGAPTRARRGRGPGGAPGSGSGIGVGLGSGEGSGLGSGSGSGSRPAPADARRPRRRRGRRGRSRVEPEVSPPPSPADAGAAPLVWPAPAGASPWHGWSGPPSPIADENVCPIHHHHVPCGQCAAAGGQS